MRVCNFYFTNAARGSEFGDRGRRWQLGVPNPIGPAVTPDGQTTIFHSQIRCDDVKLTLRHSININKVNL